MQEPIENCLLDILEQLLCINGRPSHTVLSLNIGKEGIYFLG
jgi:hypothetical protein